MTSINTIHEEYRDKRVKRAYLIGEGSILCVRYCVLCQRTLPTKCFREKVIHFCLDCELDFWENYYQRSMSMDELTEIQPSNSEIDILMRKKEELEVLTKIV